MAEQQSGNTDPDIALRKAVALAYERGKDQAPRVVAKGKGQIAESIIRVATANDIEIREDADLVEILSAIEINALIPLEAYAAVAEILSYVYRANQQLRDKRMGAS